jgi:beta-galactosidase
MLLNKEITNVQWIGKGIMPTYPGRYKAGRYGFWSLHKDDLYFEGNRQGIDAVLLTTTEGDGILLFCNNGNVSFEQTDKGIVLTYNLAVSGQGPKFARTAFPVMADKTNSLTGDFYLYRVNKDNSPDIISELFNSEKLNIVPFAPFKKQYDTYLMRFDDIVQ